MKMTPKKLRRIMLDQKPRRKPMTTRERQRRLNRALYGVK
jgi:hypothetical protein